MDKTKAQLIAEIRYAIRLCQRTARFYRCIQAIGTFIGIIGGSATIVALYDHFPAWLSIASTALLSIAAASLVAIRPADKAAPNELDAKRYQALMAKAVNMDAVQLSLAIEEARQSDAPEIDALRNVAYNDIMKEINREDQEIKLSTSEKFLELLA